jgi:hypothetical protein
MRFYMSPTPAKIHTGLSYCLSHDAYADSDVTSVSLAITEEDAYAIGVNLKQYPNRTQSQEKHR